MSHQTQSSSSPASFDLFYVLLSNIIHAQTHPCAHTNSSHTHSSVSCCTGEKRSKSLVPQTSFSYLCDIYVSLYGRSLFQILIQMKTVISVVNLRNCNLKNALTVIILSSPNCIKNAVTDIPEFLEAPSEHLSFWDKTKLIRPDSMSPLYVSSLNLQ